MTKVNGDGTAADLRFDRVADAVEDIRRGKAVIVVDDEDRENEGDIIVAAQFATPAMINFMASRARGLVCVSMTADDLDRLRIPMMVTNNDHRVNVSPFTVSVEAADGVTTGISAFDRARTIAVLADLSSTPDDLVMPGHIFPLRAHPDGLRARRGHTEASIELMQRAGLRPAAVICEVMGEDGSMARRTSLKTFARRHDLRIITISDLAGDLGLDERDNADSARENASPTESPPMPNRPSNGVTAANGSPRTHPPGQGLTPIADLPTKYGTFRASAFVDEEHLEHLVLSYGDVSTHDTPLVRIHSECLTGDALGSLRCDCGDQLALALERIVANGSGVLLYLRQEGRGIGLANKIRAYILQDEGLDTVEANICLGFQPDERDYSVAAEILAEFGITRLRLLTNNPDKIGSLERNDVVVAERVPLRIARAQNSAYMRTKAEKLQHLL